MHEVIFRFLNSFALQSEVFDIIVIFSAIYLGWILVFGLIVTAFILRFNFKTWGMIFGSALFAWVVSKIIKIIYFSPRPFLALDEVNLLFEHGVNDSFPSGHATFLFALAAVFFLIFRSSTPKHYKYISILLFLGAIVVSISRVIVGIHWPIDIIGGFALGALVSYIVYKIYGSQ